MLVKIDSIQSGKTSKRMDTETISKTMTNLLRRRSILSVFRGSF